MCVITHASNFHRPHLSRCMCARDADVFEQKTIFSKIQIKII